MMPVYVEKQDRVYLTEKVSRHAPPHLHNCLEIVAITKGTLEIGMGQELFHMEKGDIAIIFPDVIHHYQAFGEKNGRASYIWAAPKPTQYFAETLKNYCPDNPVIHKERLHQDIINALKRMQMDRQDPDPVVMQAYVQIILARSIPCLDLQKKENAGGTDLIYRTVSYIARNYQEPLTLEQIAKDLGVSKYAISRVFSNTFHRNFNTYLNEQRLNAAVSWLENTEKTITDIWLESGFESQRTFNRAFREKYKMTPSDYKKSYIEQNRQGGTTDGEGTEKEI